MTMASDPTAREAPRTLEVVCGVALGLLGPTFVVFGALGFERVREAPVPTGAFIICLVFLVAGVFSSWIAFRLLFGHGARSRTTLLSGRGWKILGAIFFSIGASLPPVAIARHKSLGVAVFGFLFLVMIARWCFLIAKRAGIAALDEAASNSTAAGDGRTQRL